MKIYKFNPLDHGYESATKFPELEYQFPILDNWFIKVVCYANHQGLVYWYSAISLSVGMAGDDRVKIISGSYDTRKPNLYEVQGRTTVSYCGLISSDKFAKELLIHIFGTTKNDSVLTDGLERYEQDNNSTMRKEFGHPPIK